MADRGNHFVALQHADVAQAKRIGATRLHESDFIAAITSDFTRTFKAPRLGRWLHAEGLPVGGIIAIGFVGAVLDCDGFALIDFRMNSGVRTVGGVTHNGTFHWRFEGDADTAIGLFHLALHNGLRHTVSTSFGRETLVLLLHTAREIGIVTLCCGVPSEF